MFVHETLEGEITISSSRFQGEVFRLPPVSLFLPLRSVFANRETWTRVSVPANRFNSHERPSIGGTRALIAFEVKYKSIDGAHAAHRGWQFDKALKFPQNSAKTINRYSSRRFSPDRVDRKFHVNLVFW